MKPIKQRKPIPTRKLDRSVQEIQQRIDKKQKLLEQCYMPKSIQYRSITQPTMAEIKKKNSGCHSKKSEGVSARRVFSATQPKKLKMRPQSVDQPLGLYIERCRMSDRIQKSRVEVSQSAVNRPQSQRIDNRRPMPIQSPKFQLKQSLQISKWDHSDLSFEL